MAQLWARPNKPQHDECQQAFLILKYTHDSVESFLDTFEQVRKARGAKGAPTDEEQDLLRAMVTFASSGLDSVAKELIKAALPPLVSTNEWVRRSFATFVERKVRGRAATDEEEAAAGFDSKFVAGALSARNIEDHLVGVLARDLTAGSLQSVEELRRVATYLGLGAGEIGKREEALRDAFNTRNMIIHEMDIDFTQRNRNRFSRTRRAMVEHTNALLEMAEVLLVSVDERLA